MDVKLPDGSVIRGVPDGMSKADLVAKLKSNGYDTSWYEEAEAKTTASKDNRVRGYGEEALRQVGLTARAGLTGVAGIPQIIGGAMEAIAPNALKGAGANVGQQLSDLIGLPKPESDIERVSQSAAGAMAGGAPFLKAGQVLAQQAPSVAQQVGTVMASQPGAQLALGGVSGAGSEAAKIGGAGELGQLAAGIAAPLVAAPLASATLGAGQALKNVIAPLVSEDAAQRGAAKLAVRAMGERAQQGAEALGSSTGKETAGQIAAAIENADLAALQKVANRTDATLADTIKQGIKSKIKQSKTELENALAPQREAALTIANQAGVDPQPILNRITAIANSSGQKSDKVVQSSLATIKSLIDGVTSNGRIDANELYTIRKKIGSTIQTFSKESSSWDKKKTASLERELQLGIDNALESAISRADPTKKGLWSDDYMSQYASGRAKIGAIEDALDRQKELATAGMANVSKALGRAENPIVQVNWLNRAAQIFNTLSRAAEGAAGSKVESQLAKMMAPKEYGGDTQKLGRLMQQELSKEPGFMASMMAPNAVSRAALGYTSQDAAPSAPTSRRVPINQTVYDARNLPQLDAPVIPGSWRDPVDLSKSSVPEAFRTAPRAKTEMLPVFSEDLLPMVDRYTGTNIPIGRVEGGMLTPKETPLPIIPREGRGLLSLADEQPLARKTTERPAMNFELRQEVLNRPEIAKATQAFIGEAERLRGLIKDSSGFWKARYKDELTALENEFAAGMRQLGIDNPQEAIGLQKLYQGGQGTKLRIEKTERK